ncbi:phosphoribosylamine--glycine ligase [Enterococcus sp. CSURQ0835]|uniref:phosphoribosylamine--glycine ligase n=1 Tax=Enterococcus sp. CSURQ0835 TaxID=2681394 RepID=UPI00135A5FC3|nr:phosphoribosylamine--glycine ligase [Enterococcus sp. CSURQ0835]
MKILVIGSGGREHAIAQKFLASPHVTSVFCAPGNPGMALDGIKLVPVTEMAFAGLIDFAKRTKITWTFVGPEQPLLAGIVDAFQAAGLAIFGPNKAAAMIEGSKEFAKQLMIKHQIPTAAYKSFSDYESAWEYVQQQGVPIVIKADGLAAGKGVVVAEELATAQQALKEMLQAKKFGASGQTVVIEEFLTGEEFSLLAFVKEEEVYPMVIAQDHKRAFDHDQGPNTGGMGAYSPVPQISEAEVLQAVETIVQPMARGMVENQTPFTGILYAGLIQTATGPKVIEFNARFGDPETQVILPRLKSDLAAVIDDLLNDRKPTLEWAETCCVGVVLAAAGYPNTYQTGMPLPIFDASVMTYYAGVAEKNEQLVANGGRVLLVAATAESIEAAKLKVEQALQTQKMANYFYRHDIGAKAIQSNEN